MSSKQRGGSRERISVAESREQKAGGRRLRSVFGKRGIRFFIVTLLFALLAACSTARRSGSVPDRPEKIKIAPLNFTLPRPEVWEMPNGIKVYFRQDKELPLVRGQLLFGGGALFDPKGSAGLFSTLGAEMREGGAGPYSADELDRILDELAAGVETSYSTDYGSAGFSCLSEDVGQVFGIFADVVRSPRFDEKRLRLWKESNIQGIKRRTESADTMTGLTFGQLVYGADSAYGEIVSEKSINAISRAGLIAAHKAYVVPAGSQLVVTGDIERAELEELIRKNFGSWTTPTGAKVNPPLPEVGKSAEPGVYVLQHDFDQASILIGHLGPPRVFPEIIQTGIYSRILGANSFSSQLMQEIRTKLGLAYSVFGAIFPGPGRGTFQVEMGTRNDEAFRAISRTLEIIKESTEVAPDLEEVAAAKRGIEQSFVFKFSSSGAITQRLALQNRFGFPDDFDDKYLPTVRAVSADDIRQVGHKFVDPSKFIIVITGKNSAEEAAAKLKELKIDLPVFKVGFDVQPRIMGRVN